MFKQEVCDQPFIKYNNFKLLIQLLVTWSIAQNENSEYSF